MRTRYLIPLVFALAACQSHLPTRKLLNDQAPKPLPQTLLILPYHAKVEELGLGGRVEEVPEWTRVANRNLQASVPRVLPSLGLTPVAMPNTLSAEQRAEVDEYCALIDRVAGDALLATQQSSAFWKAKVRRFHFGIGGGLRWLAQASGQRYALYLIADDFVSSGGRRAAQVFAALLGIVASGAPALVGAMVVDLHTGQLYWEDADVDTSGLTLRNADDTDKLLRRALSGYVALRQRAQ